MRAPAAIRPLLAAGLIALGAGCGGKPPAPERTAPTRSAPDGPMVDCLPRAEGEKLQLRLDAGYSLREIVVWYIAATCKSVSAPGDLLTRRSARAVDATVAAGEIDDLFRSLLSDLGLRGAFTSGAVMVVDGPPEVVLFHANDLQASAGDRSLAGVRKISDTHYYLERQLFEEAISDPGVLDEKARIEPAIERGKTVGFEIRAVASSSLLASLGFHAGDVVRALNGKKLDSPERALEAYGSLGDADRVEVEITRNGRPLTIVIEVR